ncbi:MAG: hypothetical protein JWO06_685, partial [Bacteroidota bacterium]|nr:hypothetical protein [Bacteroidota bacterium]
NYHEVINGFVVNYQLTLAVKNRTPGWVNINFFYGIIFCHGNILAVYYLHIKQAQHKHHRKRDDDELDNLIAVFKKVLIHLYIPPLWG